MSDKKRIYLAGPMQGIPNFNFPRFNAVAAAFRSSGHKVFNPAEEDVKRHGAGIGDSATGRLEDANRNGFSLRTALREDTSWICDHANMIVMLPGWEMSKGARTEHCLAVALQSEGMEIVYIHEDVAEMMERAYVAG